MSLLTQINGRLAASASIFTKLPGGERRMFDQVALRDELNSLKVDLSNLLGRNGDDMLNDTRARTEALADQIETALSELGDVLGQEEERVEKLISDRPIASLASAFALGIVVGFVLRRH